MRKYLPYIFVTILLAGIILMVITGGGKGNGNSAAKEIDETISLNRKDKIPYGTYVAYNSLPHLFPGAAIHNNTFQPGMWDSVSAYDKDQLFICICDHFNPDEYEMKRLIAFAESGNDVFLSARYYSAVADRLLNCSTSAITRLYETGYSETKDSMSVMLNNPLFGKTKEFTYPGKSFQSYFSDTDTSLADVLGYDGGFRPNFIRLHAGKGNFYVHTEPLAFSNYFILHKGNRDYFEKVMSVVKPGTNKIVWDEYFITKPSYEQNSSSSGSDDDYNFSSDRKKKRDWFASLMGMKNSEGHRSFRAAMLTLLFLLLLFVLMMMRRTQRMIPVIKSPANESLDFVKTIGRLYYDKGDHKNLCKKMGTYFLEHVRSTYKLATGNLDETFIRNLLYKSGAAETVVREIVAFINYADEAPSISEEQLLRFYDVLELFYTTA